MLFQRQLSSTDRFSLPFFLSASYDAKLEPLQYIINSDNESVKPETGLATGEFLWAQTKTANASPNSEESIRERLSKRVALTKSLDSA